MKTNKLKLLSITFYFLVLALWSESQCMEKIELAGFIPVGGIIPFSGEKEVFSSGWLLCDGQQCYSREYPKLYEVIKTKYVPANERLEFLEHNENNNNKKFRVPDLRGRVIVGVDDGTGRVTSDNYLGASGGTENVTLAISQIPLHDHVVKCSPQTQLGGLYPGDILVPNGSPRATQNRHTDSIGGSQPHNNMQPYLVLNYIINTGKVGTQLELNRPKENINQLEKRIKELEASQKAYAKAWAKIIYDGLSPVISASYNVNTIINEGTGLLSVAFKIPFSSSDYAITTGLNLQNNTNAGFNNVYSQVSTGFKVSIVNSHGQNINPTAWFFEAHGLQ